MLGLSTKDIASLTFREIRSVDSSRNRLRKKLGLEVDTNLMEYLLSFVQNADTSHIEPALKRKAYEVPVD